MQSRWKNSGSNEMNIAELLLEAEALSEVGGWSMDAGTCQLQWTPQAFRLHGLAPDSPQPMLEDSPADVPPDQHAMVLQTVHKAIEKGVPCSVEYTLP